jgi:hypothetical protein
VRRESPSRTEGPPFLLPVATTAEQPLSMGLIVGSDIPPIDLLLNVLAEGDVGKICILATDK